MLIEELLKLGNEDEGNIIFVMGSWFYKRSNILG
jgi:hypothetical protein